VEDADSSSIVVRPNPIPEASARKKRGRPKGSRNRSSAAHQVAIAHLFVKDVFNYELAIKLRKNGVIIAPGLSFEKSDNIKITDFTARDVVIFKRYNPQKHGMLAAHLRWQLHPQWCLCAGARPRTAVG
jgi:hypothetical protein